MYIFISTIQRQRFAQFFFIKSKIKSTRNTLTREVAVAAPCVVVVYWYIQTLTIDTEMYNGRTLFV